MQLKLRYFSRLTIIFILAVTIPGGILSYLSIQNITNLKELTERKVLEEEEALADLIYQNFQDELISISRDFFKISSSLMESNYYDLRNMDTMRLVENAFMLDENGMFLWPSYMEGNEAASNQFINKFYRNYKAAENKEFVSRNYSSARSLYMLSLSYAFEKSDSAKAMNAIARTSVKLNDNETAASYYTRLIDAYDDIYDINGFPYLSYAIPQLIKLSNLEKQNYILNKLVGTLVRLESGEVPLHYSTSLMLDEISNWILESGTFKTEEGKRTKTLIGKISNRLSFIQDEGDQLSKFANKKTIEGIITIDEGIYLMEGSSTNGEKSILIKNSRDSTVFSGFKLNIDGLAERAIDFDISSYVRFDYIIELKKDQISDVSSGKDLVTVSTISPICPNTTVWIKLKNKNLVEERVSRASWIYGIAITLLLGGMILGVFLIIMDFHRERRLSRLRSEFVSNVTHELKTPLTSIYMFAESILLGRVKTESDQKEYLGIILKETERLKRLINNILDFSRREKGKLEYNYRNVNVSELVRSSISNLDYWIEEKKFTVYTDIEEDVHGLVDPDAMKQAVINLLSNAIKYSADKREIKVHLRLHDSLIHIEVQDKGIGIAEDETRRIFEKFYRIENKETQENSGTGLGLTLVKEIVETHKGRITVESKPGHGSTFTIIIDSL